MNYLVFRRRYVSPTTKHLAILNGHPPYETLFYEKGGTHYYDEIATYILNEGIELPMSILKHFEKYNKKTNENGEKINVDVITDRVKGKIMHEMVTEHYYNWSWVDVPKRTIKEKRTFHHIEFKFYEQSKDEIKRNKDHKSDVRTAIGYNTRTYRHDIQMGMYNGADGHKDWRDGPGVTGSRKPKDVGPVYNEIDEEY